MHVTSQTSPKTDTTFINSHRGAIQHFNNLHHRAGFGILGINPTDCALTWGERVIYCLFTGDLRCIKGFFFSSSAGGESVNISSCYRSFFFKRLSAHLSWCPKSCRSVSAYFCLSLGSTLANFFTSLRTKYQNSLTPLSTLLRSSSWVGPGPVRGRERERLKTKTSHNDDTQPARQGSKTINQ